jgi:hypothetical protein
MERVFFRVKWRMSLRNGVRKYIYLQSKWTTGTSGGWSPELSVHPELTVGLELDEKRTVRTSGDWPELLMYIGITGEIRELPVVHFYAQLRRMDERHRWTTSISSVSPELPVCIGTTGQIPKLPAVHFYAQHRAQLSITGTSGEIGRIYRSTQTDKNILCACE